MIAHNRRSRRAADDDWQAQRIVELEAQVRERDALLHEVNHRAKNNLQMAMALLQMQQKSDDDPRVQEALRHAAERLGHMASVHEMLYEGDPALQSVDLARYLRRICDAASRGQGDRPVTMVVDAAPLALDPRRAVNLALIAGEAILNAYKYAFPNGRMGTIRVSILRAGATAELVVEDDGVGFPVEPRRGSLGMRLIRALSRAIGAEAAVRGDGGASVRVAFVP